MLSAPVAQVRMPVQWQGDIRTANRRSIFDGILDYNGWTPVGVGSNQAVARDGMSKMFTPVTTNTWDNNGFDFVQRSYVCPPWGDDRESNKYIMPEMLIFAARYVDTETNTTTLMTLGKINQLMSDAEEELEQAFRNGETNAVVWKAAMEKYGEPKLEAYHQRKMRGDLEVVDSELKRFYELAQQDMFCWLSRFGILTRVNFLGSVINSDPGTMLGNVDYYFDGEHYSVVNVCYAKRARVANVFGPSERITPGSRVWLTLKRKAYRNMRSGKIEYGSYMFVPGGGNIAPYPCQAELRYRDAGDHMMMGWWTVLGTVLEPPSRETATSAIHMASNTGENCSEKAAAEIHATLPRMYLALGIQI